jgi:tetratricopeptide (TPR) repeat protein
LHGRYLWFTNHNDKAGEYFLTATQLQPDYSLAWTGVADYYAAGAVEGQISPKDSLGRAKAAARKAALLDDSLAQAHVSLCAVAFFAGWDWPRALEECDRAIELDPKFAEAYHLKAKVLAALQRHDDAIQSERKAMELSPFARPWGLLLELNWARQFDRAISEARARLESAPADGGLLWGLAYAYRCKGVEAEAAKAAEKAFRAWGNPALAAEAAEAFTQGGYRAVVLKRLDLSRRLSERQYVSPVTLAGLTAQLRDRGQILALLEQGHGEHSLLLDIQFDPAYDFLHSDERYRSIIKKVGLAPAY